MDDDAPLLILGLGNPLYGDDGLGVEVVARLRDRYLAPDGVLIRDGGTLGMALLPHIQSARCVIVADAIATGEPPGTPVRLEGDQVAGSLPPRLSPHEVGVADLLFGTRLIEGNPEQIVLLGLVPERVAFGLERSEVVDARLDELVERVVAEARAAGFDLLPRGDHEP